MGYKINTRYKHGIQYKYKVQTWDTIQIEVQTWGVSAELSL